MKILNVVYSLEKGGTQRAAQNFAFGYAGIGHDSRLLYTRLDGIRREYLENKKIPIYNLLNEEDVFSLSKWIPDIIHLHSHGITFNEFVKIKNLFPNAIYVETNVFSRPSPWVDQIDLSFQLSHWCEWLYRKRSLKKYLSTIVPYPIETAEFSCSDEDRVLAFRSSYGLKPDNIVIGRVGQNYNNKWSPILIDVFDQLRKTTENLRMIMVNPPESIINRAQKSPYNKDIIHIEQIIGDLNLRDCYSSIDIFVLIAHQGESFGMVIAESLLCQTPVVTLATPWSDNSQGEVVGNRIGGFVAAKKKDVVNLVFKLVNDKSLRDMMGLAGRKRILQLYDSKKVATDSLRSLNSKSSNLERRIPADLMQDTEGGLGFISKLIISSGKGFTFLKYSTGYQSLFQLVLNIGKFMARRMFQIFGIPN